MSKISVLQRPSRKAHLPRNSFDRGFRINFNMSAGMLLPTFSAFVEAGSHCKFNMNSFLRTASVNTAAFTIMDFHTEFFAVPIRQLFSLWGAFRTRTNDSYTSNYTSIPTRLPNISTNVITSCLTRAATEGATDGCGYPIEYGAIRLLDMLNYGYNLNSAFPFRGNSTLNPLYLLAYQKIYYDHFRNSSYEANDPRAYNLDWLISNTGTVSDYDDNTQHLRELLTLRYVDYRKDFVSNIYPSLYYVSQGNLQGINVPSSIQGLINPVNSISGFVAPAGQVNTGSSIYAQRGLTIQNLRAAFAVDKLLRLSAYAPQHVVDQYQARFGVRPIGENLNESIRLGSYKSDIIIGEVTSTANTKASTVGDRLGAIGGKGIGSSDYGRTLVYDAKEDCIVMGVSYVLPRVMYDSLAIDKFNYKFVPEDYVVPEMMDMGLQPLFAKDVAYPIINSGSQKQIDNTVNGNVILGFQPRYSEYKIGVDRNHGLFNKGIDAIVDSPLSIYTTHSRNKLVEVTSPGISYQMLKCDPSDLDSIFVDSFDGAQMHDQFYGTLGFAFACVQNLSVHGESNL